MVSCCSDRLLGVGSGIPWLFSLRSLPESCEGLHNELTQLMQAYKAQLTAAGLNSSAVSNAGQLRFFGASGGTTAFGGTISGAGGVQISEGVTFSLAQTWQNQLGLPHNLLYLLLKSDRARIATRSAWWQRVDARATFALGLPGRRAAGAAAIGGGVLLGAGTFLLSAAAFLAFGGSEPSAEVRALSLANNLDLRVQLRISPGRLLSRLPFPEDRVPARSCRQMAIHTAHRSVEPAAYEPLGPDIDYFCIELH